MASVLGGPQGLLQYLMLQSNTYEKLAKANAQAINGLQPKITVWNTGESGGGAGGNGNGDAMASIRNVLQGLPPLLSTVHEQTGIEPPGWLAKMPPSSGGGGEQGGGSQVVVKGKEGGGAMKVNGMGGGKM